MAVPVEASVLERSDALRRWLSGAGAGAGAGTGAGTRQADTAGHLEVGARVPLARGLSSPLVERVEVLDVGPSGHRERHEVIVKRATAVEALVLREIASLPGAEAFPELIDDGYDEAGPWLVMPYYPGVPLTVEAELPEAVYASLALLHVRYLGRTPEMPDAYARVDARFCVETLSGFAVSGIRNAQRTKNHPVYDRALELLPGWAEDPLLRAGVELLPVTLLHGDVYGANVLVEAGSPPRLIDWGNARIGPAMLDVAMSANLGSRGFEAYLRAWETAAGSAMDPWEAEAGHAWTTAMSHAMFVGAVAERLGPEAAAAMLDGVEASLRRFGELLAQRPSRETGRLRG